MCMPDKENQGNDSMSAVYDKMTEHLQDRFLEFQKKHVSSEDDPLPPQYWVAIGGGPGAGKSTVAQAIADRLNDRRLFAVVVPMDGFHLTQKRLKEEHGEEGVKRRGAPWTFDAKGFYEALAEAKKEHCAQLPEYSRKVSNPVLNGIQLTPRDSIILVEGLYLLHEKDPEWAPLQELFDETWWVKAPTLEIQKERLVKRSMQTWTEDKTKHWGPGIEGATKRAQCNDFKNLDLIAYCEDVADVVIVTE